jgi:5-methyltetrahydrofolate--homocysteine methyltransferase
MNRKILDGVMGTMLQPHLKPGGCTELANLESPDLVAQIYSAYIKAGTDILSTNTFGASRIKLREFGLEDKTREINYSAAKLAKKAAGRGVWVAGVVGPTGKLVKPLGDVDFDEMLETFKEQIQALVEGGVDLLLLETFSDIKEIKAAVIAARETCSCPILASMTYHDDFKTFTGTDPATAANVLSSLGADVIGVNCSTGPAPMLEVVGRYAVATYRPILVEPNAGLPRLEEQKTTYQVSPEEMAVYGEKFIQIGANIVGSCCGSTPEYTAALRKRLKGKKPLSRAVRSGLRLSSRVQTIEIGMECPFCIIGERINPTNREDLAESIRNGKIGLIQSEAVDQVREGALLLDINMGVPGVNEAEMMCKAVQGIENVVPNPLSIDSTNAQAIEAALKECGGKPLINSVHGSEESMNSILPLAGRFGAGVLCLAVGEKGIPKTAEERLAVLKTILSRAESAGVRREDLICDCLTLTVSAEQKRAETTLQTLRMVKEELGLPTVLGVSNISYGLPDRSLINASFLSMAMASGLDAAIMNPGDGRMKDTVRAASVLTVRDRNSKDFVRTHVQKKKAKKDEKTLSLPFEKDLHAIPRAIIAGNRDEIGDLIENALKDGKTAVEINEQLLIPAIQEVGSKYDRKEIYLPQMILAAETMQSAFEVLEPHFKKGDLENTGKVILCTVKGDVHDIGKNIIGLFLKNQGFQVIDLGKDVATEVIVEAALKHQAQVVGLSALMTTTMTEMARVIEALKSVSSQARVLIGGAVVTKRYAIDIGADGYGADGFAAVQMVKTWMDELSKA